MLSFKSYIPDDKDFGHPTHGDDPCANLFEQYLNDDSINFGEPNNDSHDLQGLDFAFDEETESSETCSADSKHTSSQLAQHQPLAILNSAPVQAPSPQRVGPKFISNDEPRRSISSSELLNLEGKAAHHGRATKTPATSVSSSAAPTLRRKGKFYAPSTESLRSRTHRITRAPSADMIRPSFQQDNSSYNEWTHRFEQISIQTPTGNIDASPSPHHGAYRDKRPSKITTSFSHGPQQQQIQGHGLPDGKLSSSQGSASQNHHYSHAATAPLPQEWQSQSHPEPSPLTAIDYSYGGRPPFERSQTQQHLRHPSSWDYGPVSPLTPEFISPNHVHPQWLNSLHSNTHSNTHSYQENGTALQSPPTLTPHPSQEFTSQELGGFQYEPYAQFVNEDPSADYSILTPNHIFNPSTDTLSTPLHEDRDQTPHQPSHPSTPPPRTGSPSQTLPTPTKCPINNQHHSRSKSTTTPHPYRRQKSTSTSTLKSPRSASTLKSPRSASHLKSTKSASALKSPHHKSSASSNGNNGNGGGGGGGGGNFGFVNFTEADKGKILTGVAPSGSSKTKARREQEAAEKKRRMSMAAMRAIEEAGGDVEGLRRIGFEV